MLIDSVKFRKALQSYLLSLNDPQERAIAKKAISLLKTVLVTHKEDFISYPLQSKAGTKVTPGKKTQLASAAQNAGRLAYIGNPISIIIRNGIPSISGTEETPKNIPLKEIAKALTSFCSLVDCTCIGHQIKSDLYPMFFRISDITPMSENTVRTPKCFYVFTTKENPKKWLFDLRRPPKH